MIQRPKLFLSYSRDDSPYALKLSKRLEGGRFEVFLDVRDIAAGVDWFEDIELGIRQANAVVVLLGQNTARSDWVTYEYALAMGAGIPIVALALPGATVPEPMRRFQVLNYDPEGAPDVVAHIRRGISRHSDQLSEERLRKAPKAVPTLHGCFILEDGELTGNFTEEPPSISVELWLESVPGATEKVMFEILDRSVSPRRWTVPRRHTNGRAFLTDVCLYGDVGILVRSVGARSEWSISTTLLEALERHHGRDRDSEVRSGLDQFRRY